jgi:Zn-dependent protease
MDPAKIQLIAASIIPILFAITLHEVAHGWIADMRGDHTARMLGRLTLNPLKHIDPIGTVILPLFFLLTTGFMFGWAKPVPVNARYLKNPRFDMAWVAIAGPLSNILMALMWAGIAKIALSFNMSVESTKFLIIMSQIGITINLFLALLNLIPIPPLDGSRVLSAFLPRKIAYLYEKIEPFGFFILIALLLSGLLNALLVDPALYIRAIILSLFGLGSN